ncbi:MAG: hypothetical protein AAFN92_02710, partial [Bacteroidota bacterium]
VYDLPSVWTILFLTFIPLPVFMLARLTYRGSPPQAKNRTAAGVALLYAGYFAYVLTGTQLGWFAANTFPARIILFGTVPFALFLFGVVWPSRWFRQLSDRLDVADFIAVHFFRIIGGFFLVLVALQTLPAWFGLIAGIGDVTTAVTSIYVAKKARAQPAGAKRLAWAWNTFGLVDILFTAVAANVLTKLALDGGDQGVAVLAQFPFALIPAFAPPTILFLHLVIYRKLKKISP